MTTDKSVTAEMPILQLDKLRNMVSELAQAAEVSGVSVMGLYPDILQNLTSIEAALHRYMRVNDQLASINSDLTNQNNELHNVQN